MHCYDYIIVGSGASALFFVHELIARDKNKKMLILEKGPSFTERVNSAHFTYHGFGGLLKSEAKFNYSEAFGGKLTERLGREESQYFLSKVEEKVNKLVGEHYYYLTSYGEEKNNSLLELIENRTSHLGTRKAVALIEKIQHDISPFCSIRCNSEVTKIDKQTDVFYVHSHDTIYRAKKVILATNDSTVFNCVSGFESPNVNYHLDIGVRLEFPASFIHGFLKKNRELKMKLGNEAYSYCFNYEGRIIEKEYLGYIFADGQNSNENSNGSGFANFAIFKPYLFNTEQKRDEFFFSILKPLSLEKSCATQYASSFLNRQNDEIDREAKILSNPNMNCHHANLRLLLPDDLVQSCVTFISAFEDLIQQPLPENSRVYGVDFKQGYSTDFISSNFETPIKHLYAIGDLSGLTHSLSHAAASGIALAEFLTLSD